MIVETKQFTHNVTWSNVTNKINIIFFLSTKLQIFSVLSDHINDHLSKISIFLQLSSFLAAMRRRFALTSIYNTTSSFTRLSRSSPFLFFLFFFVFLLSPRFTSTFASRLFPREVRNSAPEKEKWNFRVTIVNIRRSSRSRLRDFLTLLPSWAFLYANVL